LMPYVAARNAIVTIALRNHRFMGQEVSFGDPLCKESNITASSLLRIDGCAGLVFGARAP